MCRKPVIVSDDESQHVSTSKQPWIADLKLDVSDREILLHPVGWLTGEISNAAQKLLKNQFPDLLGLQDVCLGFIVDFEIPGGEFLQILHSPNHWVTVTTIGCKTNTIKIFDSKYRTLTFLSQTQIAALLYSPNDSIEVEIMDVQTQVAIPVHLGIPIRIGGYSFRENYV